MRNSRSCPSSSLTVVVLWQCSWCAKEQSLGWYIVSASSSCQLRICPQRHSLRLARLVRSPHCAVEGEKICFSFSVFDASVSPSLRFHFWSTFLHKPSLLRRRRVSIAYLSCLVCHCLCMRAATLSFFLMSHRHWKVYAFSGKRCQCGGGRQGVGWLPCDEECTRLVLILVSLAVLPNLRGSPVRLEAGSMRAFLLWQCQVGQWSL